MKIRVEQREDSAEDEVVIRCARVTDDVRRIEQAVRDALDGAKPRFVVTKGSEEIFCPLADILFFETDGDSVYAHTAGDAYKTPLRLYELEEMLPKRFVRVSKSAILNASLVLSIDRSLASARLVRFTGSHKQVYVSRRYFKALTARLNERSSFQ